MLSANNLATELGRFITLAILSKKGPLTRNELLVFWTDFFNGWQKIQIQPGYFYPMLRNMADKGILIAKGEGRSLTYQIAPDHENEVKQYLKNSRHVFSKIIQFVGSE